MMTTTETYHELKARHRKEFETIPLGCAFTDRQLEAALDRLGVTVKEIALIGGGCFVRKADLPDMLEMVDRHEAERNKAIEESKGKSEGYLYQGVKYELGNHEFGLTYDSTSALEAVGLTPEQLRDDPEIKKTVEAARRDYLDWYEENCC